MKLYFLILLFLFSQNIFGQFTYTNSGFQDNINSFFEKDGKIFANTAENSLYVSDDGGDTWTKKWKLFHLINQNDPNGPIGATVVKVITYDKKLFGCTTKGLYVSEDDGENWQLVKRFIKSNIYGSIEYQITDFAKSGDFMFVLCSNPESQFFSISNDGGNTWVDGEINNVQYLKILKGIDEYNYHVFKSGDLFFRLSNFGLFTTNLTSLNWQKADLDLDKYIPTSIDIDGNNIIIGASKDWVEGSTIYGALVRVFTSTDGGKTWKKNDYKYKENFSSFQSHHVSVTTGQNNFFFAAFDEVWWSKVTADKWTKWSEGLWVSSKGVNLYPEKNIKIIKNTVFAPYRLNIDYPQQRYYGFIFKRALSELDSNFLASPVFPYITEQSYYQNVIFWSDVSKNEDGFKIERAELGTNSYKEIGTVKKDSTLFVDKSIEITKNYHYRVRSFKGNTNSNYSSVATSGRITDCIQVKEMGLPRKLQQPTPNVIYALAGNGIIKSLDSGLTWQELDICQDSQAIVQDISFPDVNIGYAIISRDPFNYFGVKYLMKTTDGGVTWEMVRSNVKGVQNFYNSSNTYSYEFFTPNIGFLYAAEVGRSEIKIYKTINGGIDYELLTNEVTVNYTNLTVFSNIKQMMVHYVSDQTMVGISGEYQLIISRNGGKNWMKKKLPNNSTVVKIYSFDGKRLWVIMYNNSADTDLYSTDNDGDTWELHNLPDRTKNPGSFVVGSLIDIKFVDEKVGFVIGGNQKDGRNETKSYLFRTVDGGKTWEKIETPVPFGAIFLYISLKNLNGLIIGSYSVGGSQGDTYRGTSFRRRLILTTKDGGKTWQISSDIDSFNPFSIAYSNANVGFMVGNHSFEKSFLEGRYYGRENFFYKTIDGGITWNQVFLPTTEIPHEVSFVDTSNGFISSDLSVWVTKDGGQNWIQKKNNINIYDQVFSNPNAKGNFEDYQRSYFIDENLWFRFDTQNHLYRTTNGGNSWVLLPSPVFVKNPRLAFVNQNIFYISGKQGLSDGMLYKTIDGGKTWLLISQLSRYNRDVASLYFINENMGFYDDNEVFITFDGGKSWERDYRFYFSYTFMPKVTFNKQGIGYIGGFYKTKDNGINWVETPQSGENNWPFAIIDENTAYAFNHKLKRGVVPCEPFEMIGDTSILYQQGKSYTYLVGNKAKVNWELPSQFGTFKADSNQMNVQWARPDFPTIYHLKASYTNTCGTSKNITLPVKLRIIVSGVNPNEDFEVNVFPNPANTGITIQSKQTIEPTNVSLLDSQGRLIFSAGKTNTISLLNYPEGVYLLQIQFPNGVITKKITIFR